MKIKSTRRILRVKVTSLENKETKSLLQNKNLQEFNFF